MNGPFLPIFPQGSLDSSVITTVWIGLTVTSLFNLRLGWVMSGVVVPGYLVPLFLVKPWAACVVVGEAAVTYLLVWFVFECLPRWGLGSSVFGRDRFFALLTASVLVRITCDGWLLPWLGEWVTQRYGLAFDYRNNLHSFGLIIVTLVANQFWKPGLRRGVIPLAATVGVTYLIVRLILMPFTNFSISNLSYAYEDIAASILASPKAYVILITSAYIASRMNLLYGWEYSGILLPSLLALVWYQPMKIVTSLVEALVVLAGASLILRASLFKNASIEGARKLLLFATVSYGYKFALSHAVLWLAPERKVTDFFGFGYLLATMIAVKMHEKGATARIARATVQTSLTAVAVGSVLGFSLTFLPNPWALRGAPAAPGTADVAYLPDKRLMEVVSEEKVQVYRTRMLDTFLVPLPGEINAFAEAIRQLETYRQEGAADKARLAQASELLRHVHYRLVVVENRYCCLVEMEPRRGWGFYVFDLAADDEGPPLGVRQGGLVIEAPAPLTERGAMEAAAWLFVQSNGRALAVAGAARDVSKNGAADVLRNYQTLYQAFHHGTARGDVLQVRGYTPELVQFLSGERSDRAEIRMADLDSMLWVKSSLPPSLNLARLKDVVGDFRIEWGKTPANNIQRDTVRAGFAELVLNRRDMRRVLFEPLLARQDIRLQEYDQRIDGFLQDWLLENKDRIADRGSDQYVPAQLEELLFLDEEVLTPLLHLARTEYAGGEWTEAGLEELRAVSAAAAVSGYRIIRYRHKLSGEDYILLLERDDVPQQRHWGTYVFRLGSADGYVIQIPRPLFEVNTFEYGVALFEQLRASALLIAGTNPYANRDGSADVVKLSNKCNLFALVNQVVLREAHSRPFMAVQTRAYGLRADGSMPGCDVLLALSNGAADRDGLTLLSERLLSRLERDGLGVRFVDGSIETAKYEVGRTLVSLYLEQTADKEFAVLWLSPLARTAYRQQTENLLEAFRFELVGIASIEEDLFLYLRGEATWADSARVPQALRDQLRQYVLDQDVICLENLRVSWPEYRFTRIIDRNSKQSFLAVHTSDNGLALLVNLAPRALEGHVTAVQGALDRQSVLDFIDARAMWLEFLPTVMVAHSAYDERHGGGPR